MEENTQKTCHTVSCYKKGIIILVICSVLCFFVGYYSGMKSGISYQKKISAKINKNTRNHRINRPGQINRMTGMPKSNKIAPKRIQRSAPSSGKRKI